MRKFNVRVNGKSYQVEVEETELSTTSTSAGEPLLLSRTPPLSGPTPPVAPSPGNAGDHKVTAPMPGTILAIKAKVGDSVVRGEILLILEAMKMENEIFAPVNGVVTDIRVKQGDQLSADDVLIIIGSSAGAPVAAPMQTAPAPATPQVLTPIQPVAAAPVKTTGGTPIKAPMPGLVLRINVKEGDTVSKNGLLLIMEAMKMENEIFAPAAGTVTKICVKQGDQLMADDVLAYIG